MFYNIYIRASKDEMKKAGLGTSNFDFEGKVAIFFTTDHPPLSYKEEPIDSDELTFYISSVIDQYLDWHSAVGDIIAEMYNLEEAQKQNDMETFRNRRNC